MSKVGERVGLVAAVWSLIARYPAVSAGLFQIVVVLGAAFGLHLTTTQLASGASFIAALFGLLVHAGVIPITKVGNVNAGVKTTVPRAGVVAVGKGAEVERKPEVPTYTPTVPSKVVPADPPRNPWKGN